MNKIVIIGVYCGKFPENMELWMKSCEHNKEIDFMIFTDNNTISDTSNVKFINFSLEEFSKLASEKLGLNVFIKSPYKCCDFKSVYGVIFQDYIKDYMFWGHCDFDLIFGDIRKYITDDILEKYDKILPLGHLSLYRNTKEVNDRYKCPGTICRDYKEVFQTDKAYAFDEYPGMYSIYKYNNFPFYDVRLFADITIKHFRFTLAAKDKNYKKQVFYWEDGKVYRVYQQDKKLYSEEFIYIHFQKRKNMKIHIDNIESCNGFFVTSTGFYAKDEKVTINHINKYNPYKGAIVEMFETWNYHFGRLKMKTLRKLKGVLKSE